MVASIGNCKIARRHEARPASDGWAMDHGNCHDRQVIDGGETLLYHFADSIRAGSVLPSQARENRTVCPKIQARIVLSFSAYSDEHRAGSSI
jgi:hypothetical protein